jgi:heptosyltransferase I
MAKAEAPHCYREIALVMLSAIGDAVHVLPVANAIKRARPEATITWVIQPAAHRLVYNHPAIDEFILFRRSRGARVVGDYLATGRALRRKRYDLVLALQVYMKAGLLTAAIRSPFKLGFDRARARDLNWLFTTHRMPARPMQHVQDQYFEFIEYLGIDPKPYEWGIVITEEEREAQRRFFERIDKPVCAVIVGTSKREKNWPVESYARLLEIAESDFGFQVVLVGGPSPVEQTAAAQVMELTRAEPLNELGDDLRRLVYLIDGAAVVITPDTGPLHVARALDIPVVGLYGYTDPKRSGPYRKFEDLVVNGYDRYPGEDPPVTMEWRPDGMGRITVEMAAEKVELATNSYVSR